MHAAMWPGNTFPDCLESKGLVGRGKNRAPAIALQINRLVLGRDGAGNAFIQVKLGQERPSMLLAVAVFLLQFQAAVPTALSPLLAPAADASASADRTLTTIVDSRVNPMNPNSDAREKLAEESSSLSSLVPLRMDSIYSDDKSVHPAWTGVLVAQNSQQFSTIRIPEANDKRYAIRSAESAPARRNWLVLSVLEHGAASFDAYSTRQAISRGAVEGDPLMRPFAHSPAIYAALQVGPVLLDVLARHMQRSQYNCERRTWWVPQTASTGMSIFAGVHNMNLKTHP